MDRRRLLGFLVLIFGSVFAGNALAQVCSSGIPRPPQSGPPTFADYPEFTLNFQPLDQPAGSVGHMPACMMNTAIHTWRGDIHPTHSTSTFLTQHGWWSTAEHWQGPQIVTMGNTDYYHVIVGAVEEGFVQEYYIPFGYAMNFEQTWRTPNPDPMMYRWAPNQTIGSSLVENWRSASGGSADVIQAGVAIMERWYVLGSAMISGNAESPLKDIDHAVYGRIETGNGTGNPNKVIMRQLIDSGEITQEFLKSSFTNKPKISQITRSGTDMTSNMVVDMSMHSLSDMSAANIDVVNTLEFSRTNPDYAPVADWTIADPDGPMNSGKVFTVVDAGQYRYSGGDASIGFAEGTYTYADGIGGFDYATADWEAYMNVCDPTNIWSYDRNRPQPNGSC